MKFSELPASCCFVVSNLEGSSQLLVKDSKGQVRIYMDYKPADTELAPDTEVQQIYVKKRD